MPRNKTAALFVRCTEDEAERIRRAARAERRTVSGYILNAVFNRIEMRERLLDNTLREVPGRQKVTPRPE